MSEQANILVSMLVNERTQQLLEAAIARIPQQRLEEMISNALMARAPEMITYLLGPGEFANQVSLRKEVTALAVAALQTPESKEALRVALAELIKGMQLEATVTQRRNW